MRISNGPGHEIRAKAENATGKPVKLVQWVRFGGSGFVRVIGVSSEARCYKLTASLAPSPQPSPP
jgi:hypothetical protein